MSKWNPIQTRLSELEGGLFQQVCDAFLRKKYEFHTMNRRGSMVGTDKTTKGTPDTIFTTSSGKYVFAQYTTGGTNLFAKFQEDIDKCTDPEKTGIALEEVEELILCHNSKADAISHDERQLLEQLVDGVGWRLIIVDVTELASALWEQYPRIAEEFLGIAVDTGQVLTIDDFVAQYDKNETAGPLNTSFCFRDSELSDAIGLLRSSNLLVLTGPAGVGKTRFALECCRLFAEQNSTYTVYCVRNRGILLHKDILAYVGPDGDYLLLVDDINRIAEREFVISLLNEQRANRKIKMLVTVRDYARDSVQAYVDRVKGSRSLVLSRFADDEIKALVSAEYKIVNPHFLTRIANISKGNPRLAMMAGEVATREDTLASIANVSQLYDRYFAPIIEENSVLRNNPSVKVAGMVALLRSIDRTNREFMGRVYQLVDLPETVFWSSVDSLYDAEVVDLYDHEIAKIPDQVFATYLVYDAFFRRRLVGFANSLRTLFWNRPQAAADAIYPVLEAFRSQDVFEKISVQVRSVWDGFSNDDTAYPGFLQVFWFVDPDTTLAYVARKIEPGTVSAHSDSTLVPWPRTIAEHPLLKILSAFRGAKYEHFQIAVQLLLELALRRPDALDEAAGIFVQLVGFSRDSHLDDYRRQTIVATEVIKNLKKDPNPINQTIFWKLAAEYLRARHSSTGIERSDRFMLYEYNLQPSPALAELRAEIWQTMFELSANPDLRVAVLQFLQVYAHNRIAAQSKTISEIDSKHLLPFLDRSLNPNSYVECRTVHDYLDLLDDLEISYPSTTRSKFTTPIIELAHLFLDNQRKHQGLDWEQFDRLMYENIAAHARSSTSATVEETISACTEIYVASYPDRNHSIQRRFTQWLLSLADSNPPLFMHALAFYLQSANNLPIRSSDLLPRMLQVAGIAETLNILHQADPAYRDGWLFSFYAWLPPDSVTTDRVDELLSLYGTASLQSIPTWFNFLEHYTALRPLMLVDVTCILLARPDHESCSTLFWGIVMLAEERMEAHKEYIVRAFQADPALFCQAYLIAIEGTPTADFDGRIFNLLVHLNPDFIIDFADWLVARDVMPGYQSAYRDFTPLWEQNDFAAILNRGFAHLRMVTVGLDRRPWWNMKLFFVPPNHKPASIPVVETRMVEFLSGQITHYADDEALMKFVFDVANEVLPDRRAELLLCYIEANKSIEAFRGLPIFSTGMGSWMSDTGSHEERIAFLDSLLPLLADIRYIEHRKVISDDIHYWRDKIRRNERSAFVENRW